MADLLPSSPDPSAGEGGDPRVVGVDSDDADDLLAALQSETARDLLAALYDDPAPPSALAEEVDTSIQNVRYHLDRLTDAELVTVADTIYSEKGREMKVYAPAAKPLVVFAGNDDDAPGLEAALSRLLGGLGILGLSSLAVQRLFGGRNATGDGVVFQGNPAATTETENASAQATVTEKSGRETVADSAGGTTAEEATETVRTVEEATRTASETTRIASETTRAAAEATAKTTTTGVEAGASAAAGLPPGLVFLAGGLVVLLALSLAWYVRAR